MAIYGDDKHNSGNEDTSIKKPTVWVCSVCGSADIEIKQWVKINTNEIQWNIGDVTEEDAWCPMCCDHIEIVTENEYKINTNETDNTESKRW